MLGFKMNKYVVVMFKQAVAKYTANITERAMHAGCLNLKQATMTPLTWNGPKEL